MQRTNRKRNQICFFMRCTPVHLAQKSSSTSPSKTIPMRPNHRFSRHSGQRIGSSQPRFAKYFCSEASNRNRLPHSRHLSQTGSYLSRLGAFKFNCFRQASKNAFFFTIPQHFQFGSEKQVLVKTESANVAQIRRLSAVQRIARITSGTLPFMTNSAKVLSVRVKNEYFPGMRGR